MEKWLKGKIRLERGLFNFNPDAFDPIEISNSPLVDEMGMMLPSVQFTDKFETGNKKMVPPPPAINTMTKEII